MLSYQVIKSHRYMIYVAIAMHYLTCRLTPNEQFSAMS